jgi:drug/metabolite transporter (DMT)-like permease
MRLTHQPHDWLRAVPLVFVLIWSTGFIVARYGMPHAPPLSFLCVRYALSLLCFFAWVLLARVPWPQGRQQWLHLAVVGALMHAGYLAGVWSAVKAGMGAGLIALLVGLQPVLTALWTSAMGARVTRAQWCGLLLGLAGLAMVVWHKLGVHAGVAAGVHAGAHVGVHVGVVAEATPHTLSLAVAALLCITVGTLYQKRFVAPCDVRSANAVQQLAALLLVLPFAWLEPEPMHWNAQLIGAMAWSVLVLSVGGSSLLYMLIQRGAATQVTSLLYLVPPTTAIMAWWLFGEPITVLTLVGTLLTAVGVLLVVRAPAPQNGA